MTDLQKYTFCINKEIIKYIPGHLKVYRLCQNAVFVSALRDHRHLCFIVSVITDVNAMFQLETFQPVNIKNNKQYIIMNWFYRSYKKCYEARFEL